MNLIETYWLRFRRVKGNTATDLVGNEIKLTGKRGTAERKEENQSDLSHLYHTYKGSHMLNLGGPKDDS